MSFDRTRATARTTTRAGWLAVAGLLCAAVAAPAGVSAAPPVGGAQVAICQATNSNSNPYVAITVAVASILNPGPGQGGPADGPVWNPTLKDQGIRWGDIVPPFGHAGGTYAGHNWTDEGQAIHGNGCVAGAQATEPSSAPTTEPSSAPTTEPSSAPTTEPSSAPTTEPSSAPTTEPSSAPTTEPEQAVIELPGSDPSSEPTGQVLAETGAPNLTPPPTDTMAGASAADGVPLRSLLVAVAGLLAAILLAGRVPTGRRR